MTFKKVLFVGLGGAGQRHIRIFRQLLPKSTIFTAYRRTGKTPLLRSDFSVEVSNTVELAYDLRLFDSLDAAFEDAPDLVVISTPTSCHLEPMMMAIKANCGIFVPSWHAYEDWQNLYAVRADLGGGVLLTEIHELDLANWFFGLPKAVFCNGGNRGINLLDVEDTVQITLIYNNFSAQITMCFMHKKPCRSFHIAGSEGDIKWDGDNNRLSVTRFDSDTEDTDELFITNDAMFVTQAEKFISNWSSSDTITSLAAAKESLAVVDAARRSMISCAVEQVHR